MKINHFRKRSYLRGLSYSLRVMKITIFLLFVGISTAFSTTTYSQITEISLEIRNQSIMDVFSIIEKNTEFVFFFSDNLRGELSKKVNVRVNNKTVNEILDQMFKGTNLTYLITDRQISVLLSEITKQPPTVTEIREVVQNRQITGTVTDRNGETIIGANVVVKGSSTGAITDMDGKFSLMVEPNAVLQISYIGYTPVEITITNQTHLQITLEEDSQALEEVVVVGYGIQKKVNVTGSVSTVTASQLSNRPAVNVTTALEGLAPGVRITQSSGDPGDEDIKTRIRGTSSISGNNDPLILVDGVPGDMNILNPEDIESISILKDAASASIYGSRAAAGVILVTTKKGNNNEAPKVTFNVLAGVETAQSSLKTLSNTAEWMMMHNRAALNSNPTVSEYSRYSKDLIDAWAAAKANPNGIYTHPVTGNQIPNWLAYPNTDWAQEMFKPTTYQKYNLSISGGGAKSKYLLSASYQNNPGTLDNTSLQRFNVRINLESKIADFLTVGTQTHLNKDDKDPGGVKMTYFFQAHPGITPEYDGKYGTIEDPNFSSSNNLLRTVAATGGKNKTTRIVSTWFANAKIADGLTAEVKFNYSQTDLSKHNYSRYLPQYRFSESLTDPVQSIDKLEDATIERSLYENYSYLLNGLIRYNRTFGDHDFGAFAGYEQYYSTAETFSAKKKGLIDWNITDFTSASEMASMDGEARSDYAMLSYFGRVNYSYKDRYMFEANIRADGSSRYAPGHRWGVFPSFSAAWRLSEEGFFEPMRSLVDHLKLRASWGSLGNTGTDDYAWQSIYMSEANVINEAIQNGLIQSQLPNYLLSWEKTTTTGVALEGTMLRNRLSFEFDWYLRNTYDLLAKPIIYKSVGTVSAPLENTNSMRNTGIDITLNWRDQIGKVKYSVGFNTGYGKTTVTKYMDNLVYEQDPNTPDVWGNPTWRYTNLGAAGTIDKNKGIFKGREYDEFFLRKVYSGSGTHYHADGSVNPNGGPKDGMVRSKADLQWVIDMQKAGYVFRNGDKVGPNYNQIWYGNLIYADNNGDGRYGNDDDRVFLNKTDRPKWTFGLNLAAEWKGIDMSMIWSARVGSWNYMYERIVSSPIIGNTMTGVNADAAKLYYRYDAKAAYEGWDSSTQTLGSYDPAQDPNAYTTAKLPRMLTSAGTASNSTANLYNSSFLKLRSLQVGYTFPDKLTRKMRLSNLRVYVAGENLLTFKHKDYPAVDPELGSSINIYPIARVFTGGLSVTF